MKEILFVIDSLNCGGAEKSLVSLLPLLDRAKYEVHLWMLHRGGVFETLLPEDVIMEQSPTYTSWENFIMRMGFFLYSFLLRWNRMIGKKEHGAELLWKCVGRAYKGLDGEYDVAIAYQQGLPTYIVATKILAKKKAAWINANIFNAGYNAEYNKSFYDAFDVLVPVSKELEKILRERYPQYMNKYYCVYDIINPQIIRIQARENIAEQMYFKDRVVLVTTGRLAPPKNHILAVETAKILRDRGIRFLWYFIGEGGERPNIENKLSDYGLEDYVILLGMRTNPYPYMAHCDVYVQTSSFEGFGLTIAEAKILGKPVVSTNFDVVHDQLVHEQNGLIAEMIPESVADSVIRLLTDNSLRGRIVDNVKKEENTTYITEVKKVERILDED